MDNDDLPDKLPTDKPDVIALNDYNYIPWHKAMRIFFNSKSLLPLIDSPAPPPEPDAKWNRCNRWCFSIIFFAYGKEAQDNLEDTMSAREA